MKIEDYIIQVRKLKFLQDLRISAFLLLIFVSLFFFVIVQLEVIFYFIPSTKLLIILALLSIMSIITCCMFLYWIQMQKNKIIRYQTKTIANEIGNYISPNSPDSIFNASQLDDSLDHSLSKELVKSYITSIREKLGKTNFDNFFFDNKIISLKYTIIAVWLLIIIFFSINYQNTADAFVRWYNPTVRYDPPKPFSLISLSGDIHILGGESAKIKFHCSGAKPDSILLRLLPSQKASHRRDSLILKLSSRRSSSGFYSFEIPELFQDYAYEAFVPSYHFWEAWKEVVSKPDTIFVTDRPVFEFFEITLTPPAYTKLSTETQKGNIAVIQGLKGSSIDVRLSSNRMLGLAYFNINEEKIDMRIIDNKAQGSFLLDDEGKLTVNIADERGVTNRDPVPYSLQIIPDHEPILNVIKPELLTELGSDMSIPLLIDIEDDYGFSDLQVVYEIHRPNFLGVDAFTEIFKLTELKTDTNRQSIKFTWSLIDLSLMPDDEVHFHFELSDNNFISGPQKTISSVFKARVPSLSDLYVSIEQNESEFFDNLNENLDELEKLNQKIDELNLEALKTTDLDWDQKKEIENTLSQLNEEFQSMEKMEEMLSSIIEDSEKHDLFSPSLLKKFKELAELIDNVLPEELMNSMTELNEALEKLDLETIQENLSKLQENIAKVEEDLDRFIDIFKRLQAEQKLDELLTRSEQLAEQQNMLDKEINQKNPEDYSNLAKLQQEEQRNIDEWDSIVKLIEKTQDAVKPFNEKTSVELENFIQEPIIDETRDLFNETMQNLEKQNLSEASQASEQSLESMEQVINKLADIKNNFQQQTVNEMVEKFQKVIQDLLYLSGEEEQLRDELASTSRNSPRLRNFAVQQQMLQDQLKFIMDQMMELSKETFAVTPNIGRAMGKANSGMEGSKQGLTDRQISIATQNQNSAVEGLNEAALEIYKNMKEMQQSGSSSGIEQFLQMMQKMAGQQQNLNQKGTQLALGQMAASAQQQIMQQMLKQQQAIRKSLNELANQMKKSSSNKTGDLSGVKLDMDNVIQDLKNNRYDTKTKERQKRILSRMLNSQTSMTKRGYKEERKSISSDPTILFTGPGGLPKDLGQRQSLALEALTRAIKAGYSRNHQNMIKRYFNSLSQIEVKKSQMNNDASN